MRIRGYDLDVDILEELEQFDWTSAVIKGIKFIACSPFRQERHPSFACNLETGTFADSGNTDEYLHKGNLLKLLGILRNEDQDMVEDYLIEKYATILKDTDTLKLTFDLTEPEKPKFIDRSTLTHLYTEATDYLTGRGISVATQMLFETGYNPQNNTVAFLWTDRYGRVINVKYRRIDIKAFFYNKGGQQIKNHVFGICQCIQHKAKRVFLCESEIDALTFWSQGISAIAMGGSSLSDSQKDIILSAGIEELVITTDNDLVGQRFKAVLVEEFAGHITILSFIFPSEIKDINEMTARQIQEAVQSLGTPTFSFINLSE